MKRSARKKLSELLISAPSFIWLLIFFLIPTLIVFAIAFKPSTPFGGIGPGWTLDTLMNLRNPNYPAIIARTVWLSVVSTAVCLLLAVPCGYCIARAPKRRRDILLLLVIIPFWTNFLIRIFAWKVLLHPEGMLKQALVFLHLCSPDATLLYNPFTVLLVIIYTYLPFAILPVYAAAEKFDFSLIEAARDLGASPRKAFMRVFLPGINRGIWTAVLMVFIPALGSYVIPDIVGGPGGEMIGNKIAQRTFVDRNLPHASALAALLTLAVMVPLMISLVNHYRQPLVLKKRKGGPHNET
jgi:spermidine/putrescine transport system permease protein